MTIDVNNAVASIAISQPLVFIFGQNEVTIKTKSEPFFFGRWSSVRLQISCCVLIILHSLSLWTEIKVNLDPRQQCVSAKKKNKRTPRPRHLHKVNERKTYKQKKNLRRYVLNKTLNMNIVIVHVVIYDQRHGAKFSGTHFIVVDFVGCRRQKYPMPYWLEQTEQKGEKKKKL